MVKHCCHGTCRSDNRYPERLGGAKFIPFAKPGVDSEKCNNWIRMCRRPLIQLNARKINKHTYICSKVSCNERKNPLIVVNIFFLTVSLCVSCFTTCTCSPIKSLWMNVGLPSSLEVCVEGCWGWGEAKTVISNVMYRIWVKWGVGWLATSVQRGWGAWGLHFKPPTVGPTENNLQIPRRPMFFSSFFLFLGSRDLLILTLDLWDYYKRFFE